MKGKITGERVLDVEGPKIEYSFSANGMTKGVDITHMASFWTIPRGNGVLYGEGQRLMTTTDGSGEFATEIGCGIRQLTDRGRKGKFRGSFFTEHRQLGSLALLNNIIGMFEYEVDEAGNTFHKVWEWK